MLDRIARRGIDRPLNWFAGALARLRISANAITIIGFGIGVLACVAIAFQWYLVALGLILLNRLADGLDGALARRTGTSDIGGYLDIVLDTLFYSGVPFAFAIAQPEALLPAAFLIYSFVGTGGSFLAYGIIAAKRKMSTERSGKKSFFYAAGLMEGTETILFFVLFCLFPEQFALLAWIFGALCWLTTLARILDAVRTFRTPIP